MSEATSLIKAANESAKDFNGRLMEIWSNGNNPVGEATLYVVDGLPVVVLMGALEAANEEDVEEGRVDSIEEPVMSSPPIGCAVCKIQAQEAPDKSELRLEKIFELAGGSVVDVQIETGDGFGWIKNPEGGEQLYLPTKTSYALVSWEVEPVDENEDEAEEAEEAEEEETPAKKPAKRGRKKPTKEVEAEVIKKDDAEAEGGEE